MSSSTKKCLIFFEFISFILIILSYLLYTIQSFVNQNFTKHKSKSALTEKLLYENFGEEIYNNIRSKAINKIINGKNSKMEKLNIVVKLNTSFDCRGVKAGLLNEDYCQDKIVNNITCCKSECCYNNKDKQGNTKCNNYNFNTRKTSTEKNKLTYNYDEIIDDPRRRYCQYMNLNIGETSTILNYNLLMEPFNYTYEDILLNQDDINTFIKIDKKENIEKDFTDCGEIDSLKNHLFVKGIKCPINFITLDRDYNILAFDTITPSNLPIIIKNYLSEIPPLVHEWNDVYKSGNISIKDINELFNRNINDNSDNDNYFKRQDDVYFYINQLQNNFKSVYTSDKANYYQKIYWYTTNYIGFESGEDLEKFKNIFNENELTDNPLYKICESLIPSVGTSVVGIILTLLYIIFLIKYAVEIKNNIFAKRAFFKVKEIIILGTLIVYFIIYLVYVHSKFKKISINMDSNYQEILDLYNERRTQKYFLAGIILHFIAFAYDVLYYCYKEKKQETNLLYMKNLDDNDSTEINNNLSNTAEQIDRNVEIIQNSGTRMKDSLKISQKINVIKFQPA